MGLLDRVRTGLVLVRQSIGLLRDYPSLLVFPVLSALSLLVFFVGGVLAVALFAVFSGVGAGVLEGFWWYATLAVGYFVAAVLTTYFNAALVHEATRAFRGEAPTLRSGLAAAWGVKGKVVVWGLVSSVVGIVVELVENSDRRAAWLVSTLLRASWAVLTFFVVPVLVFSDTGIRGMFEESARTFRDVWGESVTASLGVDLLSALAFLVILAGAVLVAVFAPASVAGAVVTAAFVVALLLLFALLVVRAATLAVSKAALYEYATTGSLPGVLESVDVTSLGRGEADDA